MRSRKRTNAQFLLVYVIAGTLASFPPGSSGATEKGRKGAAAPGPKATSKKSDGSLNYSTVGDGTVIDGTLPVKVEGLGLVVGLAGTGSNPPPNNYRKTMLEQMRKRDIYRPLDLLASKDTALVLLRAYVPPGVRKGDPIDVEVWVPPGDSTTSLKGGHLLEATLTENLVARGSVSLLGEELVKVAGPLVVQPNKSDPMDATALLKGRILGKGTSLIDRNFRIVLSKEERSGERTRNLAHRINERFFEAKIGQENGLAKAKDDKLIELKLAKRYRYDIQRYLLVVRKIPYRESGTFRDRLLEDLGAELSKPTSAIDAAIRLEAIGPPAIPVLVEGLKSEYEVVRFASAQSLAYLGNSNGMEQLGRLAEHSTDYRAYAISALIALDGPASRIQLSRLLNAESAEARYGAFRALWAYDAKDSLIRGQSLNDQFFLHEINSTASPMVHLARNFRSEVVIFNSRQQLLTPFSLRAGDFILLNASANGDTVHLASFRPTPKGIDRRRGESSLVLGDVIKEAARLGASYADIVELLEQASTNGNLMGRLEINALPRAIPLETLQAIAGKESEMVPVADSDSAPSLFTVVDPEKRPSRRSVPFAGGDSTDADSDTDGTDVTDKQSKRRFLDIFRRQSN